MSQKAPTLFYLMNRLAETPACFTDPKKVNVKAVVSDLFYYLTGNFLGSEGAESYNASYPFNLGLHQMILLLCRLMYDEVFKPLPGKHVEFSEKLSSFFNDKQLTELSAIVSPGLFITDQERREELVRLTLDRFGIILEGETIKTAKDRLATLDSVERKKLIEKTKAAKQRAQELREALARQEAEEAASKMSRE